MPRLRIDGVRVHYRELGAGPVAVLLHAGASSSAQWRKTAERLSGRYRLVMPDLYGCGEAEPWPGPPEQRTHDREAQLMRGLIAQLGEPVHLVGHSLGGAIAMRLVLKNSTDILSLTLIEPISAYSLLRHGNEEQHYKELSELSERFIAKAGQVKEEEAWHEFIDWSNRPGTWDALTPEARRGLCEMTAATISVFHSNLNHETTLAECASIAVPTLAIFGDETIACYRRLTEIAAEHIPGCGLERIAGAGHMSPVTHPETLAAILGRHFGSIQA